MMAKWTVALFGHYKPQTLGWEKRARPGDVVDYKPYGEGWTDQEQSSSLIVTIDGPTVEQMEALKEPIWDQEAWTEAEAKTPIGDYTYPTKYLRKRRFGVPLTDLVAIGVDLNKMLNYNIKYAPQLPTLSVTVLYDNLNQRKVRLTDGLNVLPPRLKKK